MPEIERTVEATQGVLFTEETLQSTKLLRKCSLGFVNGKHVWNLDALQTRMEKAHTKAIQILTPHFQIVPPRPLKIILSGSDYHYGAIISEPVKVPDRNSWEESLSMMISTKLLNSEMEADLTCSHETGHYCHIKVRNETHFLNTGYNNRELIAILASLLVFETEGNVSEATNLIHHRAQESDTAKREKAVINTIQNIGFCLSDALEVVLNEQNYWKSYIELMTEHERNLERFGVKRR